MSLPALAALLALCVLLPSLAAAQTHTLRVTLHDASGRGLVGITVIVRNEDGQELARQATSAEGIVFVELPSVVRVAVEGQARGGPQLFQLGDDAAGVRLDLGQTSGGPSLNLRVEHDGLVLPDPTTMLTLEEGGPLVDETAPLPTALVATPAPLPTVAGIGTSTVDIGAPPRKPGGVNWAPWLAVLIIAFAAGVMLLIKRRRDAR
jgi:hypothetical protein